MTECRPEDEKSRGRRKRGQGSRASPADRELERGLAGDELSHMTTGTSQRVSQQEMR